MKKFLFLLLPLLLVSLTQAYGYCYQETATSSTSCGALDSGNYKCGGTWDATQTCALTYDGNYNTYGFPNPNPANVFFNYTIPPAAIGMASIWQMKYAGLGITNYSIPNGCITGNKGNLTFQIWTQSNLQNATCFDGSNWQTLETGNHGNTFVYEEGVYWDMEPTFVALSNSTAAFNPSFYTGQASTVRIQIFDGHNPNTNYNYTLEINNGTDAPKNFSFVDTTDQQGWLNVSQTLIAGVNVGTVSWRWYANSSKAGTSNSSNLFSSNIFETPINITTYNETNSAQIIRTTLTIVNNTGTYVFAEGVTPSIWLSTLSGYQQYTFSNSSYFYDRIFYFNPTTTGYNIPTKVYLLSKTWFYAATQSVVLLNSQGQSITGIVTINKQIPNGGSYTILTQQQTNTGGLVTQILDCQGSYTISAVASGFNSFSGGLASSCSPQILTIYMTQGNIFQWTQQPFQNVSFGFVPPDSLLDPISQVGFFISSTQNDLEYYNFTLAYANGTNFYNFTEQSWNGTGINNSGAGDDWNVSVTKAYAIPYIVLGLNFKTYTMTAPYFISITKGVNVNQNYSVAPGLNLSTISLGFSGFTFNILPIVFLIIMMGVLASYGFQGGLGLLFFFGIMIFVAFGWINGFIAFFAALAAFSAAYLYSRS